MHIRRKRLSFRNKLLVFGATLTGVPLFLLSSVVGWQNHQLHRAASSGCQRVAQADLDHSVESIYRLCEDSRLALERDVRANLRSAQVLMEEKGGIQIAGGRADVNWEVRNQFTKDVSSVSLPKMLAGGTWLGQVAAPQTFVPVVDDIRRLTNTTSTIFQRMNTAGDMLRVATNVIGDDGKRAIGTFIPAVGPDGKPNAVVSSVLRGETFVGRAFVVNGWYMSAYEPLRDSGRNVIGMLYVGVPEAVATEAIRRTLVNMKLGRNGYIFVVNATGATRGHYVVSRAGRRDGEDIWDSKDTKGNLFIQELCRKAVALDPNGTATERYPWKDANDTAAYFKAASLKYFQPWDWVIAASLPETEMYETATAIDRISAGGQFMLWTVGLATLAISCAIWYFLANGLTRRTDRIIRELDEASGEMSSAAAQVDAMSRSLAQDARKQTDSNHQVGASLEQMGSSAQRNLDHSRELKKFAAEAHVAAESGALKARAMTETIEEILSAGADVAKINKIIDEIAFQTNILALNAAVEAARAGEAGLGFAVVADEVRNLAGRATEAARETSERIQKSIGASRRGAAVTGEVTEKLEVIATSMRRLDELAQFVADASEQQSSGIAGINAAANQMNRGIESTASNAEEGANRAHQFHAQAQTLASLAGELSEMFRTNSSL
jgi:signal transduction histidine kinase